MFINNKRDKLKMNNIFIFLILTFVQVVILLLIYRYRIRKRIKKLEEILNNKRPNIIRSRKFYKGIDYEIDDSVRDDFLD